MSSGSLLSRVAILEQDFSAGDKADYLPKLAELRSRIHTFEEDYESRLAAVQERNQQALANLTKLQERVTRRTQAQAEMETRAAAEKVAQEQEAKAKEAQAKEAKAQKAAAEASKAAKEAKAKSRRKAPVARPLDLPWLMEMQPIPELAAPTVFPELKAALQAPCPEVTAMDMQVMLQAVGLQTPEYWQPPRCVPAVESPFVPCATPECWDDLDRGSLLFCPMVAA